MTLMQMVMVCNIINDVYGDSALCKARKRAIFDGKKWER